MAKIYRLTFFSVVLVFFTSLVVFPKCEASASLTSPDEVVKVKTAWSLDRARPGDSIVLAVVVNIKKGFYINADKRQLKPLADFKPYPTSVSVIEAAEGITFETPLYPKAIPIKVQYVTEELMSFEGRTIIFLPIKLEDTLKSGTLGLKFQFEYQACADNYCLFPQKIKLEISLPVVESGTKVSKINTELFAGYGDQRTGAILRGVQFDLFGWAFSIDGTSGIGILLLLIVAALGGLLLNFTPCVLPLIPIKIISLSHAAENRKQCFLLGLTMSVGVLVFWLGLGAMIALVADFTTTNQLFQYPAFTISVGFVIGIMATGMFGMFSVRLPNFIYMVNPEQDSLKGSFGLGVLAAILSTPCTAPFMGAAAAWAATQQPLTTLSTFAAIGIGMALPYLILSASPTLVEKMPKTGPASELIKQVMGLLMLAAAAYFIGVGLSALFSSPPNPPRKVYWWPVMFFCAAAGGWLAYRTLKVAKEAKLSVIFSGIGAILIVLSAYGAVWLTDHGPIDWEYYTPERLAKVQNEHKVVIMVFTAEWCLNCKALEQGIFKNPKIVALLAEENIVPMKVDITGNNPAGKAKLREVGNLTIPLLVIYSPNGNQIFKSDFYTVDQVYKAVKGALESTAS
jgi:thiol:disulfide interchange protein DsbD